MRTIFYNTLFILFITSPHLFGQLTHRPGTVGIGGQAVFPALGASIIVDIKSPFALQGIFGVLGDLKIYGGRVLFRFSESDLVKPYLYGLAAAWSYKSVWIDVNEQKTETVPGFGIGGGIEYFKPNLSNIGFNAEIGYGAVKFKHVSFDFSAITYGVGIHFYFDK